MMNPENKNNCELKVFSNRISCQELRELSNDVASAKNWKACDKGAALLRHLSEVVPQIIEEVLKFRQEDLLSPVKNIESPTITTSRRPGKNTFFNALEGEDGKLQALFERHLSLTVGLTWWYIHKLRVWDGYDRKGFMGIDVHSLWIAFKDKYPTPEDYLQSAGNG